MNWYWWLVIGLGGYYLLQSGNIQVSQFGNANTGTPYTFSPISYPFPYGVGGIAGYSAMGNFRG